MVRLNGEQQRQRCNRLLSSRKIVHRTITLSRSDAVVVDALQIRFFWIFWSEQGLRGHILGDSLVNLIDIVGNEGEALIESLESFLPQLLKFHLCRFGRGTRAFELG